MSCHTALVPKGLLSLLGWVPHGNMAQCSVDPYSPRTEENGRDVHGAPVPIQKFTRILLPFHVEQLSPVRESGNVATCLPVHRSAASTRPALGWVRGTQFKDTNDGQGLSFRKPVVHQETCEVRGWVEEVA